MAKSHSTLKDALQDLKSRCAKPKNVVFDIDGTLLLRKNPNHLICKYYAILCDNSCCEVTLLTARPENMRQNTIKQLSKNDLHNFDNLIMKQSETLENEECFKRRLIKEINPEISIGNRWYDLKIDDTLKIIFEDQFIVGDSFWLKVLN